MLTKELLLGKCEQVGECLIWKGSIHNGYPRYNHKTKGRSQSVNVLLYEMIIGPRPAIRFSRTCRNTHCVNPYHMKDICSTEDMFWGKLVVDEENRCWNYPVPNSKTRYGQVMFKDRSWRAHRLSYELVFGIPEGMEVCHKCDNTFCCNPFHLFLGSHQQNMADMAIKRRVHWKKITDVIAIQIREASGSHQAIAERFGIGRKTVGNIKNWKIWKYAKVPVGTSPLSSSWSPAQPDEPPPSSSPNPTGTPSTQSSAESSSTGESR